MYFVFSTILRPLHTSPLACDMRIAHGEERPVRGSEGTVGKTERKLVAG